MQQSKPDHLPDQRWSEYIQEKARAAIRIDLRDYDWMTLDPDLAKKIHAMLPHRPSPQQMREYHANRRRLAGLAVKPTKRRTRQAA